MPSKLNIYWVDRKAFKSTNTRISKICIFKIDHFVSLRSWEIRGDSNSPDKTMVPQHKVLMGRVLRSRVIVDILNVEPRRFPYGLDID